MGDRRHRFAKLLFGGDLGGDVRGVHSARHGPCNPPDEHEQYRTHRDPGSRAGELGQLVHPTTTVDGMVMTQEATIFTTTRRLTPWPEATPEPVIEDAAAWVVEMGMPMPVAPKIAVTAPMLAANAELARNVVMRRPIVSMIFQPPHTVPTARAL